MAYDSLKKALDGLQEEDKGGDMLLSDDLGLLIYESKTIERLLDGDLPWGPKIEQILQEQCQRLGISSADEMAAEIHKALDCEGFLVFHDMSPWGQCCNFLASKDRLGPAGRCLLDALNAHEYLSPAQGELLEKCIHALGGDVSWRDQIQGEISSYKNTPVCQ